MVSNQYTTYFLLRKHDCVDNNAFLFLHSARSCHNIYHYTGYQQFLFPYYTSIEKVGGTTRPRRGTSPGVSGLLTLTRNRWWSRLCPSNLIPAHAFILNNSITRKIKLINELNLSTVGLGCTTLFMLSVTP